MAKEQNFLPIFSMYRTSIHLYLRPFRNVWKVGESLRLLFLSFIGPRLIAPLDLKCNLVVSTFLPVSVFVSEPKIRPEIYKKKEKKTSDIFWKFKDQNSEVPQSR